MNVEQHKEFSDQAQDMQDTILGRYRDFYSQLRELVSGETDELEAEHGSFLKQKLPEVKEVAVKHESRVEGRSKL